MTVKLLQKSTTRKEPFKLMILGKPGTGKTRLAGTFNEPLYIDVEGGAGSATRTGQPNTLRVPQNAKCLPNCIGIVNKLLKDGEYDEETGLMNVTLLDQPITFGTVVVDSLDAIQSAHKIFNILGGRGKMRIQDWGTLLDETLPLLYKLCDLPVTVVVIAHTRQYENEDGKDVVGLAVQGGLKSQTPAFFDAILHLFVNKDNQRLVLTQPRYSGGAEYLAKDRHGTFSDYIEGEQPVIDITGDDGYPTDAIARAIEGA